jgi:RND family efflux transporter MFP subunit
MAKRNKTYYKLIIGGIILLLVLGIAVAGIRAHKAHREKVETRNRDSVFAAGLVVKAFRAENSTTGKELTLIGEARPYEMATLYAQISGYLKYINVDKGDHVTENQVLAYIDNPQIDQLYNAARSDLTNKEKILERDKELLQKQFVSQEVEDLAEANVESAQATLKSYEEQQGFKTLKAPFAGTITDRYVDPGALIQSAINSQSSSQPIVSISTLEKLRVYVYVEQKDAGFLRNGYPVDITSDEHANDNIKGTIARFAGQLDPHTRMMLVEIDIDNSKNIIVPGSFVTVIIKAPQDKIGQMQIPSNGLVVNKDKTMVAIIDKDTTLRFQPVTIGFNNGDSVTLLTGLKPGQLIALQVGENFTEGQKVRIEQDSTEQKVSKNKKGKKNPSDRKDGE